MNASRIQFAVVGMLLLSCAAQAAPRYSVRAIETPDAVDDVSAVALNDRGEVTGTLVRYNVDNRAFFWDGTGPARLLPVESGHGVGVNNRGEVVGISNDGPFVWSASAGVRILQTAPGSGEIQPFDINDAGTVAGIAYGDPPGGNPQAFRLYPDGRLETTRGTRFAGWTADAINAGGAVIGTYFSGPPGGAVWEPDGTFRLLPGASRATAINDRGEVAGNWYGEGDSGGTALWRADGTLVKIPPMPGADVATQNPYGINNDGVVVGYLNHSNHADDAFIWTEADGIHDLQALLDESGAGWDLHFAVDVNESGQIVGRGSYQGRIQGFLLTPVPEPAAAALLLLPAGASLWRRRTRRRTSMGTPIDERVSSRPRAARD